MSLEAWQIALRREYGADQNFEIKNIGAEPIFSEFIVTNPETEGRYRVAVRGDTPGDNYCSCIDFSINTLGTCKHIEFTLSKLRKKRGVQTALRRGFRPEYSEVYLRYGRNREVVFKPGMKCPASLLRLASRYFNENGVLGKESFSRFDSFLKRAGRFKHELRTYEDALLYIARVRDRDRLRTITDEAFSGEVDNPKFRTLLKTPLYGYQREGALFAAGAGRSIIADDMGLGKTIEALCACEILSRTAGITRVLIICPTSLKHQWKDEITKFTGRGAEVIEGSRAARERLYETDSFYKITNYDIIYRDRTFIQDWAPDLIILDEAQRIKNWKTRTAQSVKKLDSQYAMVLTGTPLENRLEELHSIVEFVDRYHLGPRFRFLAEHQITEEENGTGRVVGYKNLSRIAETLSPILIRRSKGEVLRELPERLEKKFFVPMTREQMHYHEENRETVARIVAKWRRNKFLSDTDQRILMCALQNMRMSCNSTYLLDGRTDFGSKSDEFMTLAGEMFEHRDTKVAVFSQWLRTHELLVRRIEPRGWRHVFFHGGVPGRKRKDLIKRFREDPDCRLFLSTDAGGVGLNLQSATAVVNMDQPWNPAVLEQRIGRVHRIGQHRPVRVVHFIAEGTIEHGMLSLLGFKKALFSGVLDGGQDEVFLGGTRLNKFMESVEKATGSIPEAVSTEDEPLAAGEFEPEDEAAAVGEKASLPPHVRTGAAPTPRAGAAKAPRGDVPPERMWADVAGAGLAFLDKLSKVLLEGESRPAEKEPEIESPPETVSAFVEKDKAGRSYLKLPIPKTETLRKVADLLYELTGGKRGGGETG
jgi:superfamily II DNA or RNA helicase